MVVVVVFVDVPAVGAVLTEALGSPVVADYCLLELGDLDEFLLAVRVVAEGAP